MLLAVPHRHDQGTARQNTKGVRLPKNKMNNNTAVKLLRRGVTLVPPPPTSPSLTGCSPGSGTHVFPSRALAVRAALRPACRRSARAITAPDGIHLSWRKRGLDGDGRPQIAHRHAPQAWHGGHCCRCWGGHHRALPGVSPPAFITSLRHSWRRRERRHQLCYSLRLGWTEYIDQIRCCSKFKSKGCFWQKAYLPDAIKK